MRQDDITAVALKIDQEQRYPILERAVQFHQRHKKKSRSVLEQLRRVAVPSLREEIRTVSFRNG